MRASCIRSSPGSPRSATRLRRPASLVALLAASAALAGGAARADTFDFAFQNLVFPPAPGKVADPASTDNVNAGALAAYRTVVSEMSVALAPKVLTPADTIGYSGFQVDVAYGFTTISNGQCASGDNMHKADCPWQYAVEGGEGGKKLPGMLHTLTVTARKGIWLPIPSFEIGAGGTEILNSSIYAVNVYAKFALHEGFHGWPVPSLAVRGSGVRVIGGNQLDLTMAQIDAMISKSFGLGGTVTLVPYFGAAWLYILPRAQVVDLTPNVDAYKLQATTGNSLDLDNNAVFPSNANANITRWRFFGGFRLNYSVLVLTAEFVGTMCGDWNGHCDNELILGQAGYTMPASNTRHHGDVPDNAATQYTVNLAAGFLF